MTTLRVITQPDGSSVHLCPLQMWTDEPSLCPLFEYETCAEHLFVDGEKGVVGVSAKQGSSTIAVKANKGVIIATSSYDHNEDMCRAFNPQGLWDLAQPQMLASAPTNTGDGIRMGI